MRFQYVAPMIRVYELNDGFGNIGSKSSGDTYRQFFVDADKTGIKQAIKGGAKTKTVSRIYSITLLLGSKVRYDLQSNIPLYSTP